MVRVPKPVGENVEEVDEKEAEELLAVASDAAGIGGCVVSELGVASGGCLAAVSEGAARSG